MLISDLVRTIFRTEFEQVLRLKPLSCRGRYSGSHASEVHQSMGDTAVRSPICTAPDR